MNIQTIEDSDLKIRQEDIAVAIGINTKFIGNFSWKLYSFVYSLRIIHWIIGMFRAYYILTSRKDMISGIKMLNRNINIW